jgi:hypothetical protein
VLKQDPVRFTFLPSHAVVLTSVRMANSFRAKLDTVEPGTHVAIVGTSVAREPLKVRLPKLQPRWRLHSGVGATVFFRPETDFHHRHDELPAEPEHQHE